MPRADTVRALLPWALLVLALALLGMALPVYWVYLMSTVAISALVARGIGLVTNQVGMITLCQMSLAAIGGWVVSWLALTFPGALFPLLVLIGGVVSAPVGLLIGLVTARIRGVELAVVTLGFAAALDLVLRQGSFPGVGQGTPVLPAAPFDDPRWFFALAWTLLVLLQLGLAALGRTRHGLGWAAVQVSERAAASMGVRSEVQKASAFAIGAMFSGVAGGMLAGHYGLLTTSVFTPLTSMTHLVTAVLCGAGVFGGAVLAGAFTVFVPELLRRAGLPLDLGNALLAVGAFDVLRRGNGGLMEQAKARFEDRRFRNARVTCDLGPATAGAGRAKETERGVLEITGLTVDFDGDRALETLDLRVDRGGVHALIGPNGAGKSTLVDAVTGFLPSYTGEIRADGELVTRFPAYERARRGIRRTFQASRAIPELTVDDYLRLAAGPEPAAAKGGPDVRELFGLPEGSVPIRLMDIGSRRILEIAAALSSRPRILLIDEPASGLADDESLALARRLRLIPAELGCTVVLIEHDMAFVRAASTTTTVLDEGRHVATGPTAQVLEDPRVIAAYLGQEAAR